MAGGPAGTPPQAGGTGRRWTESHPFVSPPPPPPSIGGGAAPAAAGKAGGGGGGGEVFKPEKPPAATLLTKAKHGWTEAQAAMRNEIWGIQGTANGLNYKAYPNAQAKGQVQVTITPKTNANIQNKNDLEAALKRLKHEFEKVGGKLTWDRVELPKTPAATPTAIPAAPAQGTSPAATGKVAESFFNSTIAGLRGRRFVAKADGNYQAGTLKITLNIAANTLQPGQHDALNIVKGNLSGITVTITDKDGKAVQL
ncbi:MAG: hypothetical protein HY543_06695 [Deltaproteobacteria bacterium]|nr:hypothetical protein [Deltaproteobacteria bacterium]